MKDNEQQETAVEQNSDTEGLNTNENAVESAKTEDAVSLDNDDSSDHDELEETTEHNENPEEIQGPDFESPIVTEEETVHTSNSDSYFDDDEEFLLGDDKVLHEDVDVSVIQQLENVVTCEVINLYKENGKVRNKYSLRNEPPIFRIESSSGGVADFVVTQELSRNLEKMFGDTRKAFHGIDPTVKTNPFSQENVTEKWSSFKVWVLENKIKAGVLLVLVLGIIVSIFL